MTQPSRIVVFSPAIVTGGPELLHQLVHAVREQGGEAAICYFPLGGAHETPAAFRGYGVPVVEFEDREDTLFVIPETETWLSPRIRKGAAAVWWMSVDNYFGTPWSLRPGIILLKLRSLFRNRPIWSMRHRRHLYQSEYARLFLKRWNLETEPLSDYLNPQHLARRYDPALKTDIIAFNPAKGAATTARLRSAFPQFTFVPIAKLTAAGVADLLASAKIYIDFGGHPGKDRLPREAAMAGCCVITGRLGSAANPIDINIPEGYKLSEQSPTFLEDFGALVERTFVDYEARRADFDAYRASIADEPRVFRAEVAQLLQTLSRPAS